MWQFIGRSVHNACMLRQLLMDVSCCASWRVPSHSAINPLDNTRKGNNHPAEEDFLCDFNKEYIDVLSEVYFIYAVMDGYRVLGANTRLKCVQSLQSKTRKLGSLGSTSDAHVMGIVFCTSPVCLENFHAKCISIWIISHFHNNDKKK